MSHGSGPAASDRPGMPATRPSAAITAANSAVLFHCASRNRTAMGAVLSAADSYYGRGDGTS